MRQQESVTDLVQPNGVRAERRVVAIAIQPVEEQPLMPNPVDREHLLAKLVPRYG